MAIVLSPRGGHVVRCAWTTLMCVALLTTVSDRAGAAEENPGSYVCIRDGSLRKGPYPTPAEALRSLGVASVEIKLLDDFSTRALDSNASVDLSNDTSVQAFRRRADELGVNIAALMTARDLSLNDVDANVAWFVRAVHIAELLGAGAIRVDSTMAKEDSLKFEERVALFVTTLGTALQKTAGSTVALGVENHQRFGNNVAFLLSVIQQVNSNRLGCTLDVGNFYWRGFPLSEVYGNLRLLAPYAKHSHFKNIRYPEKKREVTREIGWKYETYNCPLDEGDIDMNKVAAILTTAGYRGAFCIEDESLDKCATPAEYASVLQRDVACLQTAIAKTR